MNTVFTHWKCDLCEVAQDNQGGLPSGWTQVLGRDVCNTNHGTLTWNELRALLVV